MYSRQSWFKRWLYPDNRKARRRSEPRLVAYCWTGGAPKAIIIRDISSSGLFLLTDQRWYVGTIIKLTVQRLDCDENCAERSITVRSKVVRSDTIGVGLAFILDAPRDALKAESQLEKLADRRALGRFLELVTTRNGEVTINIE